MHTLLQILNSFIRSLPFFGLRNLAWSLVFLNATFISLNYSINDNTLQSLGNGVVDLGITFDRSPNFQIHIETVTCNFLDLLREF